MPEAAADLLAISFSWHWRPRASATFWSQKRTCRQELAAPTVPKLSILPYCAILAAYPSTRLLFATGGFSQPHKFHCDRSARSDSCNLGTQSAGEEVSEAVDLMHPFVEHGDNCDVPALQLFPIDEMMFELSDITVDFEFCGD